MKAELPYADPIEMILPVKRMEHAFLPSQSAVFAATGECAQKREEDVCESMDCSDQKTQESKVKEKRKGPDSQVGGKT